MLRSILTEVCRLRRSICRTSIAIRPSEDSRPKADAQSEDERLQPFDNLYEKTTSKLQWSPVDSSETGGESSASQNDVHQYLDINQYNNLLTDHEIQRQRLRSMLYFIKKSRIRGHSVPKQISPEDMLMLLGQPSITKRLRYLLYLRQKEEKAERKLNPKPPPVYSEPLPKPVVTTAIPAPYGLHLNAIFVRIRESNMHRFYEKRLVSHMPFAHKIALDFGYDHFMSEREANKAAVDVTQLYSYNRRILDPFHLTFCSLADPKSNESSSKPSIAAKIIHDFLINRRDLTFPCEYTHRPVTDVFKREQIVYLSPEGEDELQCLDEDKVYVLGVLVDKKYRPGLSAERARQMGVRSARFPGRLRLFYEEKEKPLHVVHCLKVLHHVNSGKDWRFAVSKASKKFVMDDIAEDS